MNRDWSPADMDDAPDVSAHLARLLEDEPPFRQSLAESTIAAVHAGRRRRARVRAVGVVMTGAVAAGVGVAVVVSGPFGSSPRSSVAAGPVSSAAPAASASAGPVAPASTAPVAPPSAAASTAPSATPQESATSSPPSETPGTAPAGAVEERVTRLALAVAQPVGPSTVVEQSAPRAGDESTPYLTSLRVRTPSGDLEVRVSLDADPGTSVALLTESCRLDNGGADSGRRCTPISLEGEKGTWSRTYPDQPGRASLELAATTAAGKTLHVVIDNYTASPSGTKTIGPSWSALGIDPTTVENLVRDSGLVS